MAISTAKSGGTSFLRRQGEIGGAAALIGVSLFLGLACATWNVGDPSFSQSNQNAIENWMGSSGAAAADLLMQIFGLGATLAVALPAIWGLVLLSGRVVDHVWRRAWYAVGGIVLASAALGCFAAPAGWPLPIGLGGVAGDLVLKLPAAVVGDFPSGVFGMIVAALLAAPALFLYLNGTALIGRPRPRFEDEDGRLPAEDDEEDETEGRFALAVGFLGHLAYSARSALARKVGETVQRRRQPEFGDGLRDWQDDARMPATPRGHGPVAMPAIAAAPAARQIRVAQTPAASAYVDPLAGYEPDEAYDEMPARTFAPVEAPAPQPATVSYHRSMPNRAPIPARGGQASRQEPVMGVDPAMRREPSFGHEPASNPAPEPRISRDTSFSGEPRTPALFANEPARREPQMHAAPAIAEPAFDEAAYDDAPWENEARPFAPQDEYAPFEHEGEDRAFGDTQGFDPSVGDRAVFDDRREAEPALTVDEEMMLESAMRLDAGDRVVGGPDHEPEPQGGWRGLAANIVAFPGRRGGSARVEPEIEPTRQMAPAPRAPMAPAAQSAQPQAAGHVTADQQRLRTGSGRAVALKPATHVVDPQRFELPSIEFLTPPKPRTRDSMLSPEVLQENARLLEGVLEDFGVKGEIIEVRPGPVVTLYELEPAPGIKSSRVIGLADDIARSMSAIAARVAVIPGKNAIGIELPNQRRETVYFREMIGSDVFQQNKGKLALALGKTIGGEPVIADLAKMPHLLVAGTTGSGKSVSINTMILSLLYRMTPAECRLIMIDPKMLELSIYDGIPHLLAPVVTDPKKAVVALKWTVREMEDRYRKMSKVGVRNIDGFNQRVSVAMEKGETMSRTVQTGFDRETGEPIFETEEFDLQPLPYIVVIIDEMADLMMVAGKDIEGAVQRLAQMARAAGIHVIMATQRPSVDVITGTIKANFPTRISFQVTSKIDSRTILGEQGAEQLLGMGDMLFMAGGGRTQRVHGPFVDDGEVEEIVKHLKAQGAPDYLDAILVDEDEEGGEAAGSGGGAGGASGGEGEAGDLYDQAVAVVLRDGKASTSYVQRRLGIGYNRAASIIERMEREGIVGAANHAGKREILVPTES